MIQASIVYGPSVGRSASAPCARIMHPAGKKCSPPMWNTGVAPSSSNNCASSSPSSSSPRSSSGWRGSLPASGAHSARAAAAEAQSPSSSPTTMSAGCCQRKPPTMPYGDAEVLSGKRRPIAHGSTSMNKSGVCTKSLPRPVMLRRPALSPAASNVVFTDGTFKPNPEAFRSALKPDCEGETVVTFVSGLDFGLCLVSRLVTFVSHSSWSCIAGQVLVVVVLNPSARGTLAGRSHSPQLLLHQERTKAP
mmetsp:Transcript_5033/g.14838  ORF Transcript_5033/g.14838 Transcript_5033/m.14838 type:complete len:249 (-) Transcript_5033:195-941(-)